MNARYQTNWVAAACAPMSVRVAQGPAEVQFLRDAFNVAHVPLENFQKIFLGKAEQTANLKR
jgi:hypothetical protein